MGSREESLPPHTQIEPGQTSALPKSSISRIGAMQVALATGVYHIAREGQRINCFVSQ